MNGSDIMEMRLLLLLIYIKQFCINVLRLDQNLIKNRCVD